MKKPCVVLVLAVSMLLSFGTLSFGQGPNIAGDWLLDLSGSVRGGALITINENGDFEGYGMP